MLTFDRDDAEARMAFVLALRSRGLRDTSIVDAIETLPRSFFVLPRYRDLAWNAHALPIACGQSATPPATVALIVEHLEIEPHHRILEIGTGSGYMTAVLARLAARVFSMDRWRTLITEAEQRLRALSILNVTMMVADGREGWDAQGPFDRIVTTAALPEISPKLLDQLAPDGRMIAAIGAGGARQSLALVTRRGEGIVHREIAKIRALPLTAGTAHSL